jgi:Protein of unknown function (DUF3500)
MNRSTAFAMIAAAVSMPLGVVAANLASTGPRAPAEAVTAASVAPALLASPRAADVVDAADAFLATLSEEQRAIAQLELKPELAIRWTNFPGGSDVRNGVFYRDLKPEQVEAALKVARVALGEEGLVPPLLSARPVEKGLQALGDLADMTDRVADRLRRPIQVQDQPVPQTLG